LTTYYSVRLLWWVFLSKYNGYKSVIIKVKESNFFMLVPMCILTVFTIFSGFMFKDIFIGKGSTFFQNSIYVYKDNYIDSDCIPLYIKLLPVVLGFITIVIGMHSALFDYKLSILQNKRFYNIHQFFYNRYHIDSIYNFIALRFIDNCFSLYKLVDQVLIEISGPNLVRNVYGFILLLWKKSVSNTNTSLYIHGVSLTISVIFVVFYVTFY
jgi:NADH-ubiquinone oxidoreductase chain 5